MSSLYHIVYLSVAEKQMSEPELNDFLIEFRKKNRNPGRTGMLLYNKGNFIQVIEGKKEAVQALFETISKDTRHSTVVKILEGIIDERSFPEWSMGFQRVSNKRNSKVRGFSNFLKEEVFEENLTGNTGEVIGILSKFKKHIL